MPKRLNTGPYGKGIKGLEFQDWALNAINRIEKWSYDVLTRFDIEEGTWTPELTAVSTPPTDAVLAVTTAAYTKIGRLVHIQCNFSITDIGTGAVGAAAIGGLPFAAALFEGPLMVITQGVDLVSAQPLAGFIAGSGATTSEIAFFQPADNASGAYLDYAALANTDAFFINGTYYT
jgi:hypothetical protein